MEIYLKHLKEKYFKQKSIYNQEVAKYQKNQIKNKKTAKPNKHFYEDSEKYTYTDNTSGNLKITINKPKYKNIDKDLKDLHNKQESLVEILNTHFLSQEEEEKYRSHYLQNKKEIEKLLNLIKKPLNDSEGILTNINNLETEIISVYQLLKKTNKTEQPIDWENLTKKYFTLRQQKNELVSILHSEYYIDEKIEKNDGILYTAGKDHSYFYTKKYTDNSSFNKVIEKDYSIEIENKDENIDSIEIDKINAENTPGIKKKSKKNNDCNEGYDCPEDKICNTNTGNCVSKKGSIGKKLLLNSNMDSSMDEKKDVMKSTKNTKNKNCNEGYECPEDKICNPDTGKCVNKKGAIGKKILEKGKTNTNCNEDFVCPTDKICNPNTGKCVKKNGKIGKELVSNQQKGGKKIILKMW